MTNLSRQNACVGSARNCILITGCYVDICTYPSCVGTYYRKTRESQEKCLSIAHSDLHALSGDLAHLHEQDTSTGP